MPYIPYIFLYISLKGGGVNIFDLDNGKVGEEKKVT